MRRELKGTSEQLYNVQIFFFRLSTHVINILQQNMDLDLHKYWQSQLEYLVPRVFFLDHRGHWLSHVVCHSFETMSKRLWFLRATTMNPARAGERQVPSNFLSPYKA